MVPMGDWAKSRLKSLGKNDVVRYDSQVESGFGKNISNWVGRKYAYPSNVIHMATETGNKNPMQITFITTTNHNVGDDFVREGLKYLFRQSCPHGHMSFENIHKHAPVTARHGFEPVRNYRKQKKLDKMLPLWFTKDRILGADIVVQSGAPVYWCHRNPDAHCFQNEWYEPLIKRRLAKTQSTALLNLAAGTCQRYHSDGSEFCERCNDYIRDFYEASQTTTLRDDLAQKVLQQIGLNAPVIPCSSLFAPDEYGLQSSGEDYVVLNFMRGGAHYQFGQDIHFEQWQENFRDFYERIKKHENVVFSCHDEQEVQAAKQIDPNGSVFFSKNNFLDYMKFYARAKFGIVNRVHAAFLMAAFGKPSVVIGNDTRALMTREIGLQSLFVNDADTEMLLAHYETLKSNANTYTEKIAGIKNKARTDYMNVLCSCYDSSTR